MKKGRKKIEPIYKSPEQLINMGFQMTEEAKKELELIIEQVLVNKIKLIGEKDQTYLGSPAELIKELAQSIIDQGFIRKKDVRLDEEKLMEVFNSNETNYDFGTEEGVKPFLHALAQKGEQIIKT